VMLVGWMVEMTAALWAWMTVVTKVLMSDIRLVDYLAALTVGLMVRKLEQPVVD
jgi:hypothetical protein